RFRSDLFFRLSGATLMVPPLRDRPRDIPALTRLILEELAGTSGKVPTVSAEAMGYLVRYPWPGNVRELRNALTQAAIAARGGIIEAWMLPPAMSGCADAVAETTMDATDPRGFRPIEEEVRELEMRRMREALEQCQGIQTRAAALIRMPLRTFQAKYKKYG